MTKKIVLLLIFLLSGVPRIVFGDICDQDSIENLKSKVQDVQVNYIYVRDIDEISSSSFVKQSNSISDDVYLVTISGMVDGLVAIDQDYNQFRTSGGSEIEFYVHAGEIHLEIYVDECNVKPLRTISLNLLKFNKYSQHEYCQEFKDYQLDFCDEWYQGDLNMDIFLDKLRPYLSDADGENDSKSWSLIP